MTRPIATPASLAGPLLAALLSLSLLLAPAQAAPVSTPEVEAELIAEHTALTPGENWLALRLRPAPGWHVYWVNPGDSGIPTKLDWTLPAGVTAGAIRWPYPHAESLGELTNYGYSEETLHLVPLQVDSLPPSPVELKARASWLACSDICIPGHADLTLTLPTAQQADIDPDWAPSFAAARAQLPQAATDWQAAFAIDGDSLALRLQAPVLTEGTTLAFFPYANDLVNHAAAQRIERDDAQTLRLGQGLSAYYVSAPEQVDGVVTLTRDGRTQAFEIHAGAGEVIAPGAAVAATPGATTHTPTQAAPSATSASTPPALLGVLIAAVLGGLVLNLMPCVFPVLSLKALSLARAGGDDGRERRRQTYAYTVGVIASFVVAAAAMLALRGAGEAVGWGFQLQSPVFVALLAYVMFALGLLLSGVAEVGVGLMNVGASLTQRPGLSGSFFTGVLAVVVASPCTAPFMGTALGYAMTQPPYVALLVFAALGLGLALPFLLIGWFPALARWLPKPGAWMETFKQAMAFPLYLTVVWLLWVLLRQTDAQMLARAGSGLVLIAFALWLWRHRGPLAVTLKIAALAGAIALAAGAKPATGSATPQAGSATQAAGSEAWSAARVAELRADGRTVFVDFTADWCLSCKVNERIALKTDRVQQAFAERGVVTLVGDWTRSDPAITEELARFGRNGVPLYLVYVKGGEPQILPQLLTPDIVIDAIGDH